MRRAAIFAAWLLACRSDSEHEAERVLGAIERLRDAEPATREQELSLLEATSSDVPAATNAKRACAAAYRALSHSQKLTKEAARAPIDRLKLDAAQAEIATARQAIEQCTANTRELRRWLQQH